MVILGGLMIGWEISTEGGSIEVESGRGACDMNG